MFLRFDGFVRDAASADSLFNYIRLCVERSQNMERAFRVVNALEKGDPYEWKRYTQILTYIQCQSNWTGLHMDWEYYTDFVNEVLFKGNPRNGSYHWDHSYSPSICSLTLQRHPSDDDVLDDPEEPSFDYGTHITASRFPLLRELDIDLNLHTLGYGIWSFPYDQLTDLRVVASLTEPWVEYAQMILSSEKLENPEFIVQGVEPNRNHGWCLDEEIIHADTLHSFILNLHLKTDVGEGLIQKLRFPSLRTLKVSTHPRDGDTEVDPHQIAHSLSKLLGGIESQVTCEFDDPRLSACIESSKAAQ